MNKNNNECSYGNIMRFCKHITARELKRGNDFDFIQNTLIKAVEMGCSKGLAKFFIEDRTRKDLQTKAELNSAFCKDIEDLIYATKRENNRNEEHSYKKD